MLSSISNSTYTHHNIVFLHRPTPNLQVHIRIALNLLSVLSTQLRRISAYVLILIQAVQNNSNVLREAKNSFNVHYFKIHLFSLLFLAKGIQFCFKKDKIHIYISIKCFVFFSNARQNKKTTYTKTLSCWIIYTLHYNADVYLLSP